jgi:hypothetical protein
MEVVTQIRNEMKASIQVKKNKLLQEIELKRNMLDSISREIDEALSAIKHLVRHEVRIELAMSVSSEDNITGFNNPLILAEQPIAVSQEEKARLKKLEYARQYREKNRAKINAKRRETYRRDRDYVRLNKQFVAQQQILASSLAVREADQQSDGEM